MTGGAGMTGERAMRTDHGDRQHGPEIRQMAGEMRAVLAAMAQVAEGLAAELERPPPRNVGAIEAGLHEATRLSRAFFALQPRIDAGLAAEKRAAEARTGETLVRMPQD